MLRIVFAIPKSEKPYQDKAADYEALSVKRNAPRWLKMLIKHGYVPAPAA
jgi:transposase